MLQGLFTVITLKAGLNQKLVDGLADLAQFDVQIPELTPPGEYLLRVEHIYPWAKRNQTQFFVNCAQIKILGPGGGTS